MTEGSSKGLTWATLLAGVLSAAWLAIAGCIKPVPLANADGQNTGLVPFSVPSTTHGAVPRRPAHPQGTR